MSHDRSLNKRYTQGGKLDNMCQRWHRQKSGWRILTRYPHDNNKDNTRKESNTMKKSNYNNKMMLGALVFESDNGGRYATADVMASNYTLLVRGGDANSMEQVGSDIHRSNLCARESAGVIMTALGIEHDEDTWCEIHATLEIFVSKRVGEFERRISGL